MPRLSIVIPCVLGADCFETTLASVLQNRPDDCEVLVVQPCPYTDPYELKHEVRFVEGPAHASLLELINLAFQVAEGSVVHLLSCDLEVLEGWTQPAVAHFRDPAVAAVAPLIVRKGALDQVVARGVCYRSGGARHVQRARRTRTESDSLLGPILAAGFYRRDTVREIGGFRQDVGVELADVDVALRLRSAGYRCLHEEVSRLTTQVSMSHPPLSFQSGREAEEYFWAHAARSTRGTSLLMHLASVMTELITNLRSPRVIMRLLGRSAACFERLFAGRHPCHPDLQPPSQSSSSPSQATTGDESPGVLSRKPTSADGSVMVNTRAAA